MAEKKSPSKTRSVRKRPAAPRKSPAPRGVAATPSTLTDDDIYLFNEGSHLRLWEKLGAHLAAPHEAAGCRFAVWAPNAESVTVQGDFNGWSKDAAPLTPRAESGIWEGFVPDVARGARYKFRVASRFGGFQVDKADPFALMAETPPRTGSIVWDLDYEWGDGRWMSERAGANRHDAPMSVYEVHAGSWRRVPEEGDRPLTYREMAEPLADHAAEMGFTHVEFLPLMEHPFYGSWGYQITGFFAPTSRFGTPQDLMYLIDVLHQRGIGVILDWVPSHFPSDEHGLVYFDGTHLFEHADPRQGFHPDWGSLIFNYGRNEVRSFLLSSANYWLECFHADGLRVDAVASMLYLDYSRKPGEWIPNKDGGRENLEAISFLRRMNVEAYRYHPDVQTIAEESTAWPMVSRPTDSGGLGFGFKWDMGWMHDTLAYMSKDPVYRKYEHGTITFRMLYAFNENFMLPLSHDEVVHGKGSLLAKMPGDDWQRFANLRLLFSYMFGQPGKKLLFMGSEIAPWDEWAHDRSLDWHLLGFAPHEGVRRTVADLNRVYRSEPALHVLDCHPSGFEWINAGDADQSTLTFLRKSSAEDAGIVVACNFTPVPRTNFAIGVPCGGTWFEIFNSDAKEYGGSGQGNLGQVEAAPAPRDGRPNSLMLTLPPLGAVFLRRNR